MRTRLYWRLFLLVFKLITQAFLIGLFLVFSWQLQKTHDPYFFEWSVIYLLGLIWFNQD